MGPVVDAQVEGMAVAGQDYDLPGVGKALQDFRQTVPAVVIKIDKNVIHKDALWGESCFQKRVNLVSLFLGQFIK